MLSLPGSGKTFLLRNTTLYSNELKHFATSGLSFSKLYSILICILCKPLTSLVVFIIFLCNLNCTSLFTYSRPFLVLYYRIGFTIRNQGKDLILDEGIYQFVWRIFCEIKLSKFNKKLFIILLSCLVSLNIKVVYLHVPIKKHYSYILQRKKNQNFDNNILASNFTYYYHSKVVITFIHRHLSYCNKKASIKIC